MREITDEEIKAEGDRVNTFSQLKAQVSSSYWYSSIVKHSLAEVKSSQPNKLLALR